MNSRASIIAGICLAVAGTSANAGEYARSPDADFLEYLGTMVEEKDTWLDPLVLEGEDPVQRNAATKSAAAKAAVADESAGEPDTTKTSVTDKSIEEDPS